MSLPASRMTQRSSVPAASTRKLRFVIPPDSAVRVSSRPAISGTLCMARDEVVVQRATQDRARRSLADDGLAGHRVGLDLDVGARPRTATT